MLVQPKLKVSQPGDALEREADRVAEEVLDDPEGLTKPSVVSTSGPKVQRLCAGCDEERQDASQDAGEDRFVFRKSGPLPGEGMDPPARTGLEVPRNDGRPLAEESRAYFGSRFGHDFSNVRIHTDARAADAARALNARAFTLGRDIVFADREYAPDTRRGARLLAHELTHVIQQRGGAAAGTIQRLVPWEAAQQRRELTPAAVPSGFNYELQDHRLIAHTASGSNIEQIVDLMDVLGLYSGDVVDRAALTAALSTEREGHPDGERVDIDVTPHLPQGVQNFLAEMEDYYSEWRGYVAEEGSFEDIFTEHPTDTPERRRVVERWHAGSPGSSEEFSAVCHQFAMVSIAGTGAAGGGPGAGPSDVEQIDDDAVRASLASSIAGEGPFRRVPRRDVRVGDIAVFRAGVEISNIPSRIIHSAIVIRVHGNEIELLEKTNPRQPMATRTVNDVLSHYSSERAFVRFLTPALAGMPVESTRGLGGSPPDESFISMPGTTAPENAHVLFRIDTDVLLPHEDQKLFRLIALHDDPATMHVHGYASLEGTTAYNLNLSAHRAVRVTQALSNHLPSGSRVEAFAHGETDSFGGPRENRRAGIQVTDWDFTRADLGNLQQGGMDLRIASGGSWFPPVLQENLLSTLRSLLDPSRTPSATEGVNINDFYHGHVVIPRDAPWPESTRRARDRYSDEQSARTRRLYDVELTQENLPRFSEAVSELEPFARTLAEELLSMPGAAVLYHTFESPEHRPPEVSSGHPRRNWITPLDTHTPRPISADVARNAPQAMMDAGYFAPFQFEFLVDDSGGVHVRPYSRHVLSTIAGRPIEEQ